MRFKIDQYRHTAGLTICPNSKRFGKSGTDDVVAVLKPIWLKLPETASHSLASASASASARQERTISFESNET